MTGRLRRRAASRPLFIVRDALERGLARLETYLVGLLLHG